MGIKWSKILIDIDGDSNFNTQDFQNTTYFGKKNTKIVCLWISNDWKIFIDFNSTSIFLNSYFYEIAYFWKEIF